MQFMVYAVGEDLSFRFSDCGSDWSLGNFKGGIKDTPQDVIKASSILDCLGRRKHTELGPVWHISRDDLNAVEIMEICRRLIVGPEATSTFDLTAKVTRSICNELSIVATYRVQQVNTEINRLFLANAGMEDAR
jgi:hypothetical protein